jgi:hypothetical protein
LSNTFQQKQLDEFGKDGIQYINANQLLKKYVERRAKSGTTYKSKLSRFLFYVYKEHKVPFDRFVQSLKAKPEKAYDHRI